MSDYIIFSLKHSTKKSPCFWRADDKGYTQSPFMAGHYTKQQVEENADYYNNGTSTIAIPLTEVGIESMGFTYAVDLKKILALAEKTESEHQRQTLD